ncbi:two-component system histidine kinase PnpS [Cohnella candidum]|uniref:histidine kinase n=1 Tax=Cohnella candidum TaxID=2674991 RepID=A0A3G3JTC6_9BACL|nr:ATP-binding protein [Cohnella candidum]AYQ71480.1 HAMP domain-containing protein [Cohnella candidum]
MNKFRVKLSLLFMLLIGLSVLAAGLLSGHTYRQNHQDALRANMVRELKVINATTPWPDESDPEAAKALFHERAKDFKDIAEMRVTYVLPDGTVAGDSDHDEATMDNHSQRAEIVQARQKGFGSSIRESDTLHEKMMYVAMAVKKDGQLQGFIRLAMSLSEVSSGLHDMWLALFFSLFLLFALAAIVSYRVALSVTRPLEKMTSAAQRMANMDYAIRVPAGGRDEIGALAKALNLMADNLQEQLKLIRENGERLQDVLDNMTSGVIMVSSDGRVTLYNRQAETLLGSTTRDRVGRPYTEIKQHFELTSLIREGLDGREPQYRRELHVYYPEERLLEISLVPMTQSTDGLPGLLLVLQDVTAIRRLENMRSEFVANVSHELKTPVAAVKGFAETLLSGAMDDRETARSFLTIIHEESDRLNRLIGDILELSKIESRRSPLQYSPVDFGAYLARLSEMLTPEAAKKRISLDLQAEEGLFFEADEDRLGQIMLNLLQNGINYTPEGGRVKVWAETFFPEEGEEQVRITVTDTGIGIPKKDIPRIFERFYRVDKARSRSSGGTGLGLSIVKHLVELHHGSIRVESSVGVGTSFIIELPLLQP